MFQRIYVINILGEKEVFSKNKIYQGARRAGASKALAQEIARIIQKEAYNGITTQKIFDRIKELLHQKAPGVAMRFCLKEGIRKLGPSGFSFEKYIGEIFKRWGFFVQLNQIIPGKCVTYEIDFLAKKESEFLLGECKFHNLPENRTDLKVVLATYARLLDIKNGHFFEKKALKNLRLKGILVTNTKFTDKVIKYANCVGIELLGWRYPRQKGLEYFIENQNLYPVTVLEGVTPRVLEVLSYHQLMLVDELFKISPEQFSKRTGISLEQIKILQQQAEILFKKSS